MKRLTLSALVAIASSLAAPVALAQDVAAGKTSFNKCMACHAIGEGAKNKVGPAATPARRRVIPTRMPTRIPATPNSRTTSRTPRRRFQVPRWCSRHQEREGSQRPLGVSRAIRQGRKEEVMPLQGRTSPVALHQPRLDQLPGGRETPVGWRRHQDQQHLGQQIRRLHRRRVITPEALPCEDPWRTWRGLPPGEMVLNL